MKKGHRIVTEASPQLCQTVSEALKLAEAQKKAPVYAVEVWAAFQTINKEDDVDFLRMHIVLYDMYRSD